MKNFLVKFSLFFFLCFIHFAYAEKHIEKFWSKLTIEGPFKSNKKIIYLIDGEIRLFDRNGHYEDANVEAGIGYKLHPNFSLMMGSRYSIPSQNPNELRVWQRGALSLINCDHFRLDSRSLLEERGRNSERGWAVRFKQRLSFFFPHTICEKITPLLYDEVFFNINRPEWIPKRGFSQNRAFVGLQIPIATHSLFQIGYINQWLYTSDLNEYNNLIALEVIVNP